MTEEEMENGIEAEVVPYNQLQLFINEAGLEQSLANEFVINFEEHFKMASTWAKKAKKIIVTDASQTVVMEEARTARLFLRKKRLEIENFRVARKEYFLKGGRAIDKVANFLKDTIIPIEEHLDRQEHFVEIKNKAEDERILAEAYAKQETERILREQEEAKEKERLRIENENLKQEATKKERINKEELERVHRENERVLRSERERNDKISEELRLKKQSELKAEAEIQRQAIILKSGSDLIKLQKIHDDLMNIDWPEMVGVKEKALRLEALSHVHVGILRLEKYLETTKTEEEI